MLLASLYMKDGSSGGGEVPGWFTKEMKLGH